MYKLLALAACCAAVTVPVALADEGDSTHEPEATNPCDQISGADGRSVLKRAWHRSGWRHRNPVKASQSRALKEVWRCIEGKPRKKLRAYSQRLKGRFGDYREYRHITPYRCQGGWYGTWAIPCYVIACESGFSWSAYNPSGASGPYQLLGWGAPMPANTWERKLEHHRIAASLSLSNWVCA